METSPRGFLFVSCVLVCACFADPSMLRFALHCLGSYPLGEACFLSYRNEPYCRQIATLSPLCFNVSRSGLVTPLAIT